MKKENTEFQKPKLLEVEDLTLKLIEANKKIKQEEEERIRFMSDVAHDLRAPITALRSCIDYVISLRENDSYDEAELDRMIHIMDIRTRGLQTLIQDLYFLLTLEEQAEAVYHFEEIELGALLEEYYFELQMREDLMKRQIDLDVPVDYECNVKIDVEKLVRVLDNLVSNAFKYSNDGDSITIKAVKENDYAVFSVKDTGIGIAREHIDNIFKHSYQISKARTPDADSGSGLGLTIVKTIIEQHGGEIWVESEPGEGSEFFVKLPVL